MSVDAVASEKPVALLYPELENELTMTRAMLALAPVEKYDWAPHAKSMTLGQITSHMAGLPMLGTLIITLDEMAFDPEKFKARRLADTAAVLALFDRERATLQAAVDTLDWDKLNATWRMTVGGQVVVSSTRRLLLRTLLINHVVHHRAQLGVFLRLLDVPLPGTYGPSADS